jgi:hypothetical protein
VCVGIFAFGARLNPIDYLIAWTRLRPRLTRDSYDVVHAHFTHSGLLALPKRLPLVVTFHARDLATHTPATATRLRCWAARVVAQQADAVIVGSEDLRRRVESRAPVHVIPTDVGAQATTARLLEIYRSLPG